ncbi:histidine kinase [Nocardiopsis sp. RSe5-2]|uniref:histidine kinase n=1 Tax=Nocardiopsis endophytica TaxID=3018445 RepID=A0ABT4UCP5_9ACTN|nr:histidine kinase [Nocardiopsis endophytica]MDA2814736.1 histidine kinase [Nocardiopsis endophytica]
MARSVRRWALDALAFAFVLAWAPAMALVHEVDGAPRDVPEPLLAADTAAWAAAAAAVWVRRRWPVGTALFLVALSTFSELSGGAMLVALYGVALRRPTRTAVAVGAAAVAAAVVFGLVRPEPGLPFGFNLVFAAAAGGVLSFAVLGWGMYARARRSLVESLRERAVRAEGEARAQAERVRLAEREAELVADRARLSERERITREMHDVLGHRLSLLSVHAGALEYRRDAPPEEVAGAAGVIRDSAHRALEDLREVIGMLRAEEAGERPQPGLDGIASLVGESRDAGMDVGLDEDVTAPGQAPGAVGRSAYRVVQECLTNARKHAPGARVGVRVAGGPGDGLEVEVVSGPSRPGGGASSGSGAGAGLVGLSERVALAGGTLEHGPRADGGFAVRAWLPWAA